MMEEHSFVAGRFEIEDLDQYRDWLRPREYRKVKELIEFGTPWLAHGLLVYLLSVKGCATPPGNCWRCDDGR